MIYSAQDNLHRFDLIPSGFEGSRRKIHKVRRELLGFHFVDITVTASEVEMVSGSSAEYEAGETLTAGQPVYLDSTLNQVFKADVDTGDSRKAKIVGITLHASVVNQPIKVQTGGVIDIGATITLGEIYVGSGTAGGIAPVADLAANDYTSIIGVGQHVANKYITLRIFNSDVLHG